MESDARVFRDLHLCENVSDNSSFVIFRYERDLRPCQPMIEICTKFALDPSARESEVNGSRERDSHNTSFDSSIHRFEKRTDSVVSIVRKSHTTEMVQRRRAAPCRERGEESSPLADCVNCNFALPSNHRSSLFECSSCRGSFFVSVIDP